MMGPPNCRTEPQPPRAAKAALLASLVLAGAQLLMAPATRCEARDIERIHGYHADVDVRSDGSLLVKETIRVTSAGVNIKRGIYRDFPTVYSTGYFAKVRLPFDVVSVKRDGHDEPYHTENQSNGVRVYVGSEDVHLPDGEHTYEIAYTTNYQLGYFDKFDELYWNVTGNGWDFAIDRGTASVRLPRDVPLDKVQHEGYTGPQGSKARNLESRVDRAAGTIEFATTEPLGRHEGLTLVVQFPKGYVHEPTDAERRALFLRSNRALWVMPLGLLAVLGYFVYAWVLVGRDPPGDVIIPQFDPPMELTPACMRYLRRMGYDRKCFTAAILNLAVKGRVTIEDNDGEYTLRRNGKSAAPISNGEAAVFDALLSSNSIQFKQVNHARIKSAIEKLGQKLSAEFEGKLFRKNRRWLIPGALLSLAALAATVLASDWAALPLVGFMSIWLSFWTFACAFLGVATISAWRSALALRRSTLKRIGSFGSALFFTAFATPFFIGEVVGVGVMAMNTSVWIVPMVIALLAINWWFWYLIKQPTVEGRRVMEQIEGFRMYLGTAEKEYLERMHPPAETPALFEKYLPYALALDVENQWAEKFTDVLARAAQDRQGGYQPAWYHGNAWQAASAGDFASSLGSSLGSAISSSATAPGSSSGGGGGGSSGGGGGGGGGGGW